MASIPILNPRLKHFLFPLLQLILPAGIIFTLSRSASNKIPVWNTINIIKAHTGFVILPDSSYVNLNAGSLLKVATSYKTNRVMLLDGEGCFKFKPGAGEKVLLKTRLADIFGCANSFNVSTYDDELFVACLDGSVSVKIKNGRQLVLNAGSAVKYDPDSKSWATLSIDQDTVTSWIRGVYYFDEEKLENICKRVERVYDARIVFDRPACKNYSFSGKFRKEDSIHVVLENLSHASDVNYFFDQAGIIHLR